jgi:hypothetical protein
MSDTTTVKAGDKVEFMVRGARKSGVCTYVDNLNKVLEISERESVAIVWAHVVPFAFAKAV